MGPPSDTPVAAANVAIPGGSNSFQPNDVYVLPAGTVTWTNNSGTNHNVTFSGGTVGAPANVAAFTDGSVQRTFTTSGTYNYQCTLHAGMSGRVRVQ